MKTFCLSLLFSCFLCFQLLSQSNIEVNLHWVEKNTISELTPTTWGVPWKKGTLKTETEFSLKNDKGDQFPVQSWVTAYWPDGSVKWTAHAAMLEGKNFVLEPSSGSESKGIEIKESEKEISINTKYLELKLNKQGSYFLESLKRNGKIIAEQGKLVLITQDQPDSYESGNIHKTAYASVIKHIEVEKQGPVRTVVKVEGTHRSQDGKELIPFILRLYLYANSESIKMVHTLIYNADENKDFIKGIGLRLNVPLQGEMYNRHVRFVGENDGVFAESVRPLTGLRINAGENIRKSQVNGLYISKDSLTESIQEHLSLIPAYGDYSLSQLDDKSFSITKRTSDGHAWLASATGGRSAGTGYIGTPSGGLAFGIRNFWQSYPAQLDIQGAISDTATVTLWLWSPKAPAMDLRFYHDGLGEDTYPEQRKALEVTYEDYEPDFGTPYGVARTSELSLWALDQTPTNTRLAEIARLIQNPPQVICSPDYLWKQEVFGNGWSLPDTTSVLGQKLEKQLTWNIDYYKKQIDEHSWYGFWNYGDFMHTYDTDRHVWRYDIGGYAWDNSELSTDLWLWYSFLRTGEASTYRIAEAMTRHTGEVDVYHIGKFAPLGSRHNVMHWGCSAKQLRISTAINRRFLYYLTADERIGDLMHEQVNGVEKLHDVVPSRKLDNYVPETRPKNQVLCSFGTDWGSIAAAWFTEWERTKDPAILKKLTNSMKTIAAQPHGFYNGASYMDTNTGAFEISKSKTPVVTHLNAVFGLTEICSELIHNLDVPAFKKAWLEYCRLYNAPGDEQKKELGEVLELNKMPREHSRLTAYAAYTLNDSSLGKRAWKEFLSPQGSQITWKGTTRILPPEVLSPVTENTSISTNSVAQWSLAAMENMTWARKWMNLGH